MAYRVVAAAGVLFLVAGSLAAGEAAEEKTSPEPSAPASAAAAEELAARLAKIDREIAELRKLKKDIEQLGKDLKKEKDRTGFLTDLDQRFDLGGKVELELVDPQDGRDDAVDLGVSPDAAPNGDAFLMIRKIRLAPKFDFTKKEDPIQFSMAGQLDFLPRSGEPRGRVKEFYAAAEGMHTPWAESQLKVGLDDRFMTPDHETRIWPLSSTAFWRNEEMGFFWRTRAGNVAEPWGRLGLYASLTNGISLDDSDPNEADGFGMIGQDAHFGGSDSTLREYGVGLSWERRWFEAGDVPLLGRVETEVLGFYYNDSLADADRANLATWFAGSPVGTSNLRGRELWGGNAVLHVGGLTATAHLMKGRDGRLERKGGYLEGMYLWEFPEPLLVGQVMRGVIPLVRYEWLSLGTPAVPTNPLSWDRKRWVVGLIGQVMPTVDLKVEYAFNEEDTGGRDPKNDELVVTLEVRF